MLADDLGSYELGYKNPLGITPNLDTLANEGIKLERHYVYHVSMGSFTSFFCHANIPPPPGSSLQCCGPTRSATMSGRLPYHGNQHNVNDINSTSGVDLRMTMLPQKLKTAGYATSMIGKSHLGSRSVDHLPINRGFDQHFGFLGGKRSRAPH
jgi:arylsulfatase A-like enzyme